MAENEVLDVRWGRRWKTTRQLLVRPDVDPATLAHCACADAVHDVRRVLKRALQKGASLIKIFEAASGNPAAMKAAVSLFPDQQLARFVRGGCHTSDTMSARDVAYATAALMFDALVNRTVVFAGKHDGWRADHQRELLRTEMEQRRDVCVAGIAEILEKSLRGEAIKAGYRHRSRERVTAKVLVNRSLRVLPAIPRSNERIR